MAELQESLDFLNWKETFYSNVLSGETKYFSNLINVDEK